MPKVEKAKCLHFYSVGLNDFQEVRLKKLIRDYQKRFPDCTFSPAAIFRLGLWALFNNQTIDLYEKTCNGSKNEF